MLYGHDYITPGTPLPLGATEKNDGVQFSVFSRHAKKVFLLLFDDPKSSKPSKEIELDREHFLTGDIWHIHIKGLTAGQLYLYRMDGEYNPEKGHRFNPNVYLLDPFAKALTSNFRWDLKEAGAYNTINDKLEDAGRMPKCVVVSDDFDWEDDRPLKKPLSETVIYETHVRGLTVHHTSGVNHPGTYRGVIDKIPYFKKLGVTALEFLPINEFDMLENYRKHPETNKILKNYWGYSTMLFFAPNGVYAYPVTITGDDNQVHFDLDQQVKDFKLMVKELHKNGIEVIMDVVFNHTSEGNSEGPTISFKGMDNSIYYMLNQEDKSKYKNYSGCGNTLNCNHPIVRNFIKSALLYWVNEMHVDGFRFDLASILGRDQNGEIMENPPLLESIAEDPLLRDIKIIAEAWDAGGAYQVGGFRNRWGEWNGKYRDDIRKVWRGFEGMMPALATRIAGSSDLYHQNDRTPLHSVNFITSHDGFTLNDLVSYNKKHNEDNGENNRDGSNMCFNHNYGVEGDTDDAKINEIRERQIKNMLATLFISQGVPMILGGDEFRRTQKGNNNAYCQDNEISWYNWDFLDKNKNIYEFTKSLIKMRKDHPVFTRDNFFTGETVDGDIIPDITWFDADGDFHEWDKESTVLAVRISGHKNSIKSDKDDNDVYIMFNTGDSSKTFTVPQFKNKKKWRLYIDTALDVSECFPKNINDGKIIHKKYKVADKSFVLLFSV